MRTELLRFNGAVERDPAIDARMREHSGELGAIDWQRSLKKLFSLAEVSGGHPHRFRHTFAVELLLARVPIERVSVLLGHSSTRITETHYSAWVHARQEQLEADVRASWALESSLLSSAPGTYRARDKSDLASSS